MEATLSIDDMKTKTREFLIEDGKLGASDIIREFVQTRPLRVKLTKPKELKNGEPQCPECHSLAVEQGEPEPVAVS